MAEGASSVCYVVGAGAAAWPHANYSRHRCGGGHARRTCQDPQELPDRIDKDHREPGGCAILRDVAIQAGADWPGGRSHLGGRGERPGSRGAAVSLLELALVATLSRRPIHSTFSIDDLVVAFVRPIDARPLLPGSMDTRTRLRPIAVRGGA